MKRVILLVSILVLLAFAGQVASNVRASSYVPVPSGFVSGADGSNSAHLIALAAPSPQPTQPAPQPTLMPPPTPVP